MGERKVDFVSHTIALGPHPAYGTTGFKSSAALSSGEGLKILRGYVDEMICLFVDEGNEQPESYRVKQMVLPLRHLNERNNYYFMMNFREGRSVSEAFLL